MPTRRRDIANAKAMLNDMDSTMDLECEPFDPADYIRDDDDAVFF